MEYKVFNLIKENPAVTYAYITDKAGVVIYERSDDAGYNTGFKDFFEKEVPANPQKAEYLLPTLIGGLLRDGKCTVKVLETPDNWFGVTYKEDKPIVVESFRKLIADGVYREELYSDLFPVR